MQNVKANRDELLEKLKANRKAHRDLFLKAQQGYRAAVIVELDKMLAEAKDGRRLRRYVELAEPIDQTSEYDSVIAMLEMSVDDVIELRRDEFECYVMDKWAWRDKAFATNSTYTR